MYLVIEIYISSPCCKWSREISVFFSVFSLWIISKRNFTANTSKIHIFLWRWPAAACHRMPYKTTDFTTDVPYLGFTRVCVHKSIIHFYVHERLAAVCYRGFLYELNSVSDESRTFVLCVYFNFVFPYF